MEKQTPKVGDRVFIRTAGFMGMGAVYSGTVYASKRGLRVRIDTCGSLIGGGAVKATRALTPAWTVEDDPWIEWSRQEAKRAEQESQEQSKREAAQWAERRAANLAAYQIPETFKKGDLVYVCETDQVQSAVVWYDGPTTENYFEPRVFVRIDGEEYWTDEDGTEVANCIPAEYIRSRKHINQAAICGQ